jgi:hypothetical protein
MQKTFRRGIFDRYDGWRVRNVDTFFSVAPFVLRTRIDSQCFFEETIPIEHLEAFIRKQKETMPDITFMHVIIAAMVRMFSQRPYLNRFIVWNKIYARNSISLSLAIKRSMTDRGEETIVKPEFEPTDTLSDIVRRVAEAVDQNKTENADNSTDKIARLLGYIPAFLLRFVVWFLRSLDNVGKLPRAIQSASPFHSSMFLTNLGSLGIGPIYHHLYEFGTVSVFAAMGNKTRVHAVTDTGEREMRRFIGLKFVTDERICDGYYYASSMKLLRRLLLNPETLLTPPETVAVDDGVAKPRMDTTHHSGK